MSDRPDPERVADAMIALQPHFERLAEAMRDFAAKMIPAVEKFMRAVYDEAGRPYGDSPEAMVAWFRDQQADELPEQFPLLDTELDTYWQLVGQLEDPDPLDDWDDFPRA